MMNIPLSHGALKPLRSGARLGRARLAQSDGGGTSGASMLRVEDDRLVRGRGCFVDDLAPEGCLHLVFVRPAEPAGRILSLACSAALSAPGVVAAFTGADVAGCAWAPVNPLLPQTGEAPFELLSLDVHRAPAQPIAAIVATSRVAAIDAAELVAYRIAGDGHADVSARFSGGWGEESEKAFEDAAHVVSVAVQHALLAPLALEPRATLAAMTGDTLVVHASTQTPHRMRTDLGHILGMDVARIRVIAPDVGGAFGGKASITPEDAMVCFAARHLGLPVKWSANRSEEFLSAPRGRGGRSTARLALDENGRFLGLDAEFAFPLGHWLPYSAPVPARNAARILPGPYLLPQVSIRTRAEASGQSAINIYRGAGRPEAAMLLERLVDRAAAQAGIDPMALRLKNLPKSTRRQQTAAGDLIDRGDYRALIKAIRDAADYKAMRRRQRARQRRGEVVGIGLALYVEPCGQGWESGRVGLLGNGQIVAATGSSAQGQGRETAYAAIVAGALGVDPGDVTVWHGDTATTPAGIGALASRSTAIGGSAIRLAAEKFLDQARRLVAEASGCAVDGLVGTPAGLSTADGQLLRSWAEIAGSAGKHQPADALVLSADAIFEARHEAWASGAVLTLLSIARDTGELTIERMIWADDAGNVVNPMLVKGQLIGGMAQGFGEAVMEALRFSDNGELLTGSLQDYAVPRALDMPQVELLARSVPSAANPLGAKGVGEAGTIGTPAAILNGVLDALKPFGVEHLDMPLTSEKLWRAMRGNAEPIGLEP